MLSALEEVFGVEFAVVSAGLEGLGVVERGRLKAVLPAFAERGAVNVLIAPVKVCESG